MAFQGSQPERSNWMSFSDVMTGLMVIFMFIAISYIIEVKDREEEVNQIVEEYAETQSQIYEDLDSTFSGRFEEYDLRINPDLSIQIIDSNALFPVQEWNRPVKLTPKFRTFLAEFTPLFYKIILNEKYKSAIAEIRIEGHTSIHPNELEDNDEYYSKMLVLSQKRSNKVLENMLKHKFYTSLSDSNKKTLRFITTSNGLAYGKSLDSNGEFKHLTGRPIDRKMSKRVEFRIVTNKQKILDEWLNKIKQNAI